MAARCGPPGGGASSVSPSEQLPGTVLGSYDQVPRSTSAALPRSLAPKKGGRAGGRHSAGRDEREERRQEGEGGSMPRCSARTGHTWFEAIAPAMGFESSSAASSQVVGGSWRAQIRRECGSCAAACRL